jgi:dTDP-4-dehydrorhamnose 3,5-epimerase-like enzyme
MIVNNCNIITLPEIIDINRGKLVFAEVQKHIPFEIKRVFYIYLKQNVLRGNHSHKQTEQLLIPIDGKCDVFLNDGENVQYVDLSKNNEGLYIGNSVWHNMIATSERCILLVLASTHYDESDYIRDYDEFLKYVNDDN